MLLIKSYMEKKIKKELEKIRPMLQADGGDVEFVSFDEKTGVVKVQMMGMCSHCPMSQVTLKEGIEAELKKTIPEIKEVVGV